MHFMPGKTDLLLMEIRKITRSIDLYSKQLEFKYGLTGPQLLLLKSLLKTNSFEINSSLLAKQVSLSQATITSILDRLCEKGYVTREKTNPDKRKTTIRVTDKAKKIFKKNPPLLQESFIKKFNELEAWEQSLILSSFERISSMMETLIE